jgi:hypothetical protein
VFAGSIPENYGRYLVPLIFTEDIAQRVAARSPTTMLETADRPMAIRTSIWAINWTAYSTLAFAALSASHKRANSLFGTTKSLAIA